MKLVLTFLLLLKLSEITNAQEFLILCESTDSKEYKKLSLLDEGTYFLLQGLNTDNNWEGISYFPYLHFSNEGQIGYKSEEVWPCDLGDCYRNEYFSYNKTKLQYSKYIKSLNFSTTEVISSQQCLFDFPNK